MADVLRRCVMKMSKSLVILPFAATALVLGGCASMQSAEVGATRYEPNTEYMAKVERQTRRMPVRVIWVNPPEKKVPVERRQD
jgi:hypothetical protein